jgi:hypothetical protein
MEDSCLGVWVAHGEGCATFDTAKTQQQEAQLCLNQNLVALQYADDSGAVSTEYPFCPNGSPLSIAGLCSKDGRHLAMMPHPERATLPWQWAYMPKDMADKCTAAGAVSPWMKMFQNAASWCMAEEELLGMTAHKEGVEECNWTPPVVVADNNMDANSCNTHRPGARQSAIGLYSGRAETSAAIDRIKSRVGH